MLTPVLAANNAMHRSSHPFGSHNQNTGVRANQASQPNSAVPHIASHEHFAAGPMTLNGSSEHAMGKRPKLDRATSVRTIPQTGTERGSTLSETCKADANACAPRRSIAIIIRTPIRLRSGTDKSLLPAHANDSHKADKF
jgi:hypothetical protein